MSFLFLGKADVESDLVDVDKSGVVDDRCQVPAVFRHAEPHVEFAFQNLYQLSRLAF